MNRKYKKCLLCYKGLKPSEGIYHPACSRKFFGNDTPPGISYTLNEQNKLAKKIVLRSITIPGVQEKLSLNIERNRKKDPGKFTIVGLWGGYILKPPVSKYPAMPEIEDLTMHLAPFFGIETVPHGLIPLKSGELAYITKRIDRDSNGNKIHIEDMCQLTGSLTEHKYRGSMEKIGKAIYKYSSNPLYDAITFFEVALFSFLSGNADMHLKNFSLIYSGNNMIRLSPAYDLLSSRLLISEKDDPEEMALTLNGKRSRLKLSDFNELGLSLRMNSKQLENVFNKFKQNLIPALDFIDKAMLSKKSISRFKELVIERAKRFQLI